jgi:o-succinylbenzoate synthase
MEISISKETLHFKKPARTSRGEYSLHEMYLITLTDKTTGKKGTGELAPLPDLSCDRNAYPDIPEVRRLAEKALPSVLNGTWPDDMLSYPALRFALESAVAEARGEELKERISIPINGLVWMSSFEDMLEQVKVKMAIGFRCIKLKIGAIDWQKEIELIRYVRSYFPKEDLQLRVDANGAFAPEWAMDRLIELSKYDIHSIEQPIRQGQWDEMARLCKESPLAIALDEEMIGVNDPKEKARLLDTIHPQYIVLKPTMHGGISGTREWIDLANKRGISSWITSALESNIGLRSIALLAESVYGPNITFPQGLGTGQLFTDNIENKVQIEGACLAIR